MQSIWNVNKIAWYSLLISGFCHRVWGEMKIAVDFGNWGDDKAMSLYLKTVINSNSIECFVLMKRFCIGDWQVELTSGDYLAFRIKSN